MSDHNITATNGAGSTAPLAVSGYNPERQSRNIIHDLLDGSIGVSFIPPRPRSGTLVTVYDSKDAAFQAYRMYGMSDTFSYTFAELPEAAMVFALDGRVGISPDREVPGVWYVEFGYQEVSS